MAGGIVVAGSDHQELYNRILNGRNYAFAQHFDPHNKLNGVSYPFLLKEANKLNSGVISDSDPVPIRAAYNEGVKIDKIVEALDKKGQGNFLILYTLNATNESNPISASYFTISPGQYLYLGTLPTVTKINENPRILYSPSEADLDLLIGKVMGLALSEADIGRNGNARKINVQNALFRMLTLARDDMNFHPGKPNQRETLEWHTEQSF